MRNSPPDAGRIPAPVPTAPEARPGPPASSPARDFIRGSSLLLFGRFLSVLLNLAVQVLTVRYLSKSDYGAFAYALGVVSIGSSTLLLGLGKAVPRFVPIYHERGDGGRAFGTIVLAAGTIVGLGVATIVLLYGLRGVIAGTLITDPLSLSLLLVLIALAPIQSLDNLLQKLAAVFIGARAIFFRRHVLGPSLRLAAIGLVILTAGDVHLLAYGYLVGGLIGVWLYVALLVRAWRRQNLLRFLHPRRLSFPAREIFGFSIPMLSAELSVITRGSLAVLLLEYFHTTAAVAEYRAVLPLAGLNMVVSEAFAFLFMPIASRLFARGDLSGINDLYWQTSIWISVLTFPVLAMTCALAQSLTVILFGSDYAGSATILALLALGHYFNAAMGFNAETLRVHGRVRFVFFSDVLSAAVAIVLSLLLIPRYGALGAALAMTTLLVFHNLLNHLGLWLGDTEVRLVDGRFFQVHAVILASLGALLSLQWLLDPPVHVGVALALVASVLVVRFTRRVVNAQDAFPELLRIPLVRQLLT